jgi:hypothetical protein
MMSIPATIPGYRLFLVLFGLYGAIWIVLEGNLLRVIGLGLFAAGLILLTVIQRRWAGRSLSSRRWLVLCAVGGLWLGLGGAMLTLLFMALKSGLHAHGWEYSVAETQWMVQQLPIWGVSGLLLGVGVGLISAGWRRRS